MLQTEMNHDKLMERFEEWHKSMKRFLAYDELDGEFKEVIDYINYSHEAYLLLEKFARCMLENSDRYGTYNAKNLTKALDAMQIYLNGQPREDFFEAVRDDPEINEKDREYWLKYKEDWRTITMDGEVQDD